MSTDNLADEPAVNAKVVAAAPSVTVPVVVPVAPVRVETKLELNVPVMANVLAASAAIVTAKGAVVLVEPEAEPVVATLMVSTPLTVTELLAVVPTPLRLMVTASVVPAMAVSAIATVVLLLVPVTLTTGIAVKAETLTSAVDPTLVTVVTPAMPDAAKVAVPPVAVKEMTSMPVA